MANYDNLQDRLEQAKKEEAEFRNPFRLPNGKYNAKLKDLSDARSKNGNSMFVAKLKIRSDNEQLNGKTITVRWVKKTSWQFDRFLMFMELAGVDLSKVTCDNDFIKIFDDLEDDAPNVYLELKRDEKNDAFENIYIIGVGEKGEEDIDLSTGNMGDGDDKPKAKADKPAAAAPKTDSVPLKDESGTGDTPF